MSSFNTKMFDSIKQALQKNSAQTGYKNILKFEKDKVYTVRLLPNVKQPEKTFFHFYTYDWTSYSTGQYTSALSPATFGERCPMTETKYRLLRNGTEEEKQKANAFRRNERWLVNVYVIDDPSNPENNGTIKIARYGKQLHKIISDAIDGEGAEDFGPRIFDLSENGVNLKIKAEQQGDYITYVSSKFTMPRKIEGLTDAKAQEIYDNIYDLTSVIPTKSQEELLQVLDEHFFAKPTLLVEKKETVENVDHTEVKVKKEVVEEVKSDDVDPSEDENLQKLLADLDS